MRVSPVRGQRNPQVTKGAPSPRRGAPTGTERLGVSQTGTPSQWPGVQCPLHSPGPTQRSRCFRDPPRAPHPPQSSPRRRQDSKGLCAPVPTLLSSSRLPGLSCDRPHPGSPRTARRPPAPGVPWVSTRKASMKVTAECYLHGVNRPLSFLSPACRDQERGKQQLTSLPGERPRGPGACLGGRAPGQRGELRHPPAGRGAGGSTAR